MLSATSIEVNYKGKKRKARRIFRPMAPTFPLIAIFMKPGEWEICEYSLTGAIGDVVSFAKSAQMADHVTQHLPCTSIDPAATPYDMLYSILQQLPEMWLTAPVQNVLAFVERACEPKPQVLMPGMPSLKPLTEAD